MWQRLHNVWQSVTIICLYVKLFSGDIGRWFCKHRNDRNCSDEREKTDKDDQQSDEYPCWNLEVVPILPLFSNNKEGKCGKEKQCDKSSPLHQRIGHGIKNP